MTETTTATEISQDVRAERERIVTAALAWAQGDPFVGTRAVEALRAIGLGEHLPRETAEVFVHVTGTVTVGCQPDGSWTEQDALRALQNAVYGGRAIVETREVTETGAPGEAEGTGPSTN